MILNVSAMVLASVIVSFLLLTHPSLGESRSFLQNPDQLSGRPHWPAAASDNATCRCYHPASCRY